MFNIDLKHIWLLINPFFLFNLLLMKKTADWTYFLLIYSITGLMSLTPHLSLFLTKLNY